MGVGTDEKDDRHAAMIRLGGLSWAVTCASKAGLIRFSSSFLLLQPDGFALFHAVARARAPITTLARAKRV